MALLRRMWVLLSLLVLYVTVDCQIIVRDFEYEERELANKYYARNEVPTSDQDPSIMNWCGERFGKNNDKCVSKLQELCNIQNENFTQTCPFLLRSRLKRAVGGRTQKASKQDLNTLQNAFNQMGQNFLNAIFAPKSGGGPQGDVPQLSDARVTRSEKNNYQANEMTQNDPDGYFHGDMDLTKGQTNYLMDFVKLGATGLAQLLAKGAGRKKRKMGREPAYHLWDVNPIPYSFDRKVPAATQGIIEQAINLWESNTCRRWAKDIQGEDRVEFVNGDGCSSFVGKTGGSQEISLLTPGCDVVGIASHEIGHSLGFFHEQGRPDQTDNVVINKANIQPSRMGNFVPMPKKDVNTFNMAYDYGSVMHYDSLTRGFTYNPNKYSIVTKDDKFQSTIGQRAGPSFIDFKLVNLAYCSNICQNKIGCLHDGYEDPNNCNQCKCPTGFGGRRCESVSPSSPGCGGIIKASGSDQYITSPGFPGKYPSGKECNWLIVGPDNGKIYLTFDDSFSFPCDDVCSKSYVEVKRFSDFQRTGYRFCCDKSPKQIVSEGNEMIVIFKSGTGSLQGFRAKVSTDGSGIVNVVGTQPPPIVPTEAPVTSGGSGNTPKNPNGCQCQEWSGWSDCTQQCGGCGYINRQRSCNRNDCYNKEKKHCNFDMCPSGQNVLISRAQFDLVFSGCCIGFLGVNGKCGGLNEAVSQFFSGIKSGK